MATRKPKSPELAAAADELASAVQHIRQAINNKLDEIGTVASAELDKAMQAARSKRGQAEHRFDALWAKAQKRLLKASDEAKKSLHKAVRQAEKRLEMTKKRAQVTLAELAPAGAHATKKVAVRKPAARKAVAAKTVAGKAAPRKAAARKTAG